MFLGNVHNTMRFGISQDIEITLKHGIQYIQHLPKTNVEPTIKTYDYQVIKTGSNGSNYKIVI